MKFGIILSAVLLLQMQAQAALECEIKEPRNKAFASIQIKVEAEDIRKDSRGNLVLSDVVATVKSKGYGSGPTKEVGYGKTLKSNVSYKPRKYKNHWRLELSDLDMVGYQNKVVDFTPLDTCVLELLIPDTFMDGEGFDAPLLLHCDQSGGSTTLDCRNL